MSVSLLIEEINDKAINKLVPISTEKYFAEIWLPICEKEGFEWIPLFESGAPFTDEDLSYILEELYAFKKACKKYVDEKNNQVYERLDLLIENLESLKGKKSKFYIG